MGRNLQEEQFFLEQVQDNYKNPQNRGRMVNFTFSKHMKNQSCGDVFDIYVKLDDRGKKIEKVMYEGEGCAISTASFSLLSQKLKGMSFLDAKALREKDIFDMLGIKISPGRLNCALLSFKAFKSGTEDFEKK